MHGKPLKTIFILTLGLLSGCTAEHYSIGNEESLPSGVIHEDPPYEIVDAGYLWQYDERHGWGWHHPQRGWRYPNY